MLYVAGSNLFGQLNHLLGLKPEEKTSVKEFSECCYVDDLSGCWSTVVSRIDQTLTMSGFDGLRTFGVPVSDNIRQIECSRFRVILNTSKGELWARSHDQTKWENLKHLLPSEDDEHVVVKVSSGPTMTAVLTETGRAFVLPSEELVLPQGSGQIVDLSVGNEHGVIVTSLNMIFTWGSALRGQIGNGGTDLMSGPVQVEALAGIPIVSASAGGWHCAAVSSQGDLYTWGWNKSGQLALPPLGSADGVSVAVEPRLVEFDAEVNIKSVHCGTSHTIAISSDGELWGAGWNKWGQLGLGDSKTVNQMTKISLTGEITKVICSSWNTFVFTKK